MQETKLFNISKIEVKLSIQELEVIRTKYYKKFWNMKTQEKGYWRISNSLFLVRTLSNKYLKEQGFIMLTERYLLLGNSY